MSQNLTRITNEQLQELFPIGPYEVDVQLRSELNALRMITETLRTAYLCTTPLSVRRSHRKMADQVKQVMGVIGVSDEEQQDTKYVDLPDNCPFWDSVESQNVNTWVTYLESDTTRQHLEELSVDDWARWVQTFSHTLAKSDRSSANIGSIQSILAHHFIRASMIRRHPELRIPFFLLVTWSVHFTSDPITVTITGYDLKDKFGSLYLL